LIYQGFEEETLDQKITWPSSLGVDEAGQLFAHHQKTRNAKIPNPKPRNSDGDRRLMLRKKKKRKPK